MSDSGNRGRRLRLTVLFGILGLALLAWWYDWKVARPAVDAAWEQISKLNEGINAKATAQAMTNQDVQNALNRKPARMLNVGDYQVEVYSWVAGLPFRTHDYYAVYNTGGGSLLFSTHFKFELPREELEKATAPAKPEGEMAPPTEGPMMGGERRIPGPQASGEGPGADEPRGKRKRTEEQPQDDAVAGSTSGEGMEKAAPATDAPAGAAAEPKEAPSAAETPAAAEKQEPVPPAETPANAEKQESAPPAEAPAESPKPEAAPPAADSAGK
jgi:hypothetical protein